MHLHSILDGRSGEFRVRGAAWELESRALRGFLYLIPVRGGGGRHRVVEAEGGTVWSLLDALSGEISAVAGATVKRLNARAVSSGPAGDPRRRRNGASARATPDPDLSAI